MSMLRKTLLWAVLLAFGLFTTRVVLDVGYIGLWASAFQSGASLQILLDLCICCGLISLWVISDARQRGVSPWPWLVAIVFMGSIAVLGYLLTREYAFGRTGHAARMA